jgi:hypothetical protein
MDRRSAGLVDSVLVFECCRFVRVGAGHDMRIDRGVACHRRGDLWQVLEGVGLVTGLVHVA